jgi:DNA-binding NarL/FixJ family response regulator
MLDKAMPGGDMLRAGARSFWVKGCPPDVLVRTIRTATEL